MKDILSLYEDILIKEVKLSSANAPVKFKPKSSLHSVVTDWAYGKMIEKTCYDIGDGTILKGNFDLSDIKNTFKLKINCNLKDWEKYYNDLTICINDTKILNKEKTFIENVNIGWSSLYFDIPENLLKIGNNTVEISTSNTSSGGLMVAQIKVLCFPEIVDGMQISFTKYCKKGDRFSVAVRDEGHQIKAVKNCENCTFLSLKYFDNDCILTFCGNNIGTGKALILHNNNKKLDLILPEIVENQDNFIIGIDSDDHRHDNSEEFHRILNTAIYTDMGNFIQFRPQKLRNYLDIADEKTFSEKIEKMSLFNIKFGIANTNNELNYLAEKYSKDFYGYHVHEPYLFFNFNLENMPFFALDGGYYKFNELRNSTSFEYSKELYANYLNKLSKDFAGNIGLTSVGSPSLLCVYEGDAGFDRITIEPVSNINILVGAVRATSVKKWGAHIPTDWYYGIPVDYTKSMKFLLSMQFIYLNGGDYLYAENSVFKTHAFERLDFEDEYIKRNRQILRDFYAYTVKHPRKGELIVDKAFVYGRNEYFMWQSNDRMAELLEKDWDSAVWGKWDNKYHKCWQITKSFMPISTKQNSVETPLNTKLFAGTPYGSVDVVYADKDFSKYKVLSFTGWNTMTDELFERLEKYVENGGNLVISYCHLNKADCNDGSENFIEKGKIEKFVGCKIEGTFKSIERATFVDGTTYLVDSDKQLECVKLKGITAKKICEDKFSNGYIFKNNYGKGSVYFCTFKDYFCEDWAVNTVSHLLDIIGKNGDIVSDNNNISFTIRKQENGGYIVNVMNNNCFLNAEENFTIKIFDKVIKDNIKVGEIKEYNI